MSRDRHLRVTRRQALASGGYGLLAGALHRALQWDGLAAGGPEPFHFVVVSDLHIVDDVCAAWLAGLFRRMGAEALPIDFCLALGDLTHDGTPDQLAQARDAFARLGVPVYPVIGNHDQNHPAGRRAYEDLFPGRINYHFEHKGWQFMGLDSTDGSRWEEPFPVGPHTLRWLDTAVPQLDRKKPTALFTHFPLGPEVWGRPTNAPELIGRFAGHNLSFAFSGHSHRLTWRWLGKLTLTTNHCCSFREPNHDGVRQKAYFLCCANVDGSITTTYVGVQPGDPRNSPPPGSVSDCPPPGQTS
jgi:3',5'-cyclic AMP phosphodiesterase CpdA